MPNVESRWFIDGKSGKADLLLDIRFGHAYSQLVWRHNKPRFMWQCDSEKEWKDFLGFCCQWNVEADFYEKQEDGTLELKFSVPTAVSADAAVFELGLVKFDAPKPTLLAS